MSILDDPVRLDNLFSSLLRSTALDDTAGSLDNKRHRFFCPCVGTTVT